MGSSKKATVGYWYKQLFHFKLTQGPIDTFLAWRGGDRNAWEGELNESGTIAINAPALWGGEEKEGGIQGDADILFGEAAQMPSPYLLANLGEKQSAMRGEVSAIFKGGKWGANNPYPKPAAFKFRRIFEGWEEDVCWYPEKAAVGLSEQAGGKLLWGSTSEGSAVQSVNGSSWPLDQIVDTGASNGEDGLWKANGVLFIFGLEGLVRLSQDGGASWRDFGPLPDVFNGTSGVTFDGTRYVFGNKTGSQIATSVDLVTVDLTETGAASNCYSPASGEGITLFGGNNSRIFRSVGGEFEAQTVPGEFASTFSHIERSRINFIALRDNGTLLTSGSGADGSWVERTLPVTVSVGWNGLVCGNGYSVALADDADAFILWSDDDEVTWNEGDHFIRGAGTGNYDLTFEEGYFYYGYGGDLHRAAHPSGPWVQVGSGMPSEARRVASSLLPGTLGLIGMNPAHILYDSHIFRHMDGQSVATLNDASMTAAADRLFSEGIGLCAEYDPNSTSVEEFQQRICNIIGGSFSQDDATGEFHLDLIRPDFDIDDLPILTDDDVLEFSEEPSTLDIAVNSLRVKWFDPQSKEERITEPLESLGAIQAFGINSDLVEYPEIPVATLAARIGQRDLDTSTTPTRKFDLKVTRIAYAWRKFTRVRIQLLKRGIADMVCIIGEKDNGTLRSGAIQLKLVQDSYSMPSTTYVVSEDGEDTGPTRVPVSVVHQLAFEVPYVELAGRLSTTDLSALAPDAGFVAVVGADPANTRNYSLFTQPAGGEYSDQGVGDWCPTALVVESAAVGETAFTLSAGVDLDRVVVGTAAMWGGEIVRVDAIDPVAGTLEMGRGCADTVDAERAAGERIWFYDADAFADSTEYVGGETVNAKLLTNTVSLQLDIAAATALPVVLNERQSRPYPPAKLRINTESVPTTLDGELTVAWAHRDRLLQADQLVDSELDSVGPEPTARYALRFLDDAGYLLIEKLDISPAVASATAIVNYTGDMTMELYTINDFGESWQKQVRTFDYAPPPGTTESVIDAPTWTPVEVVIDGGEVTP